MMPDVPPDPATVRSLFQAMTDQMASFTQVRYADQLANVEARLAQYGPGWHDLPDFGRVNFGAQAAQLRADLSQIGTWLSNARSVLASTGSGAIQAMQQMLSSGSFGLVVEEGAATLEANAPAVALTTGAVAVGVVETGGLSTLAMVGLGLAGGLLALGLIGGGIYAWNRYHQPQNTALGSGVTTTQAVAPTTTVTTDTGAQVVPPTAPDTGTTVAPPIATPPAVAQPPAVTTQAAPPLAPGPTTASTTAMPTLDVDGTYTMSPCPVAACSVRVVKQSDASGSQWSDAGSVALTIVEKTDPSSANDSQEIGPMTVSLRQDGSFQGSGTATEGDFGGVGKLTSHPIQFSIYGQFRGGQGAPPTTSGGPVVYRFTLNGNSGANANGAVIATGSR